MPGPADDSKKYYCPKCSQVGIQNKLMELYLDRFQCQKCGRMYNLADLESDKDQ
jgi:ribosomal protein S27AE